MHESGAVRQHLVRGAVHNAGRTAALARVAFGISVVTARVRTPHVAVPPQVFGEEQVLRRVKFKLQKREPAAYKAICGASKAAELADDDDF